MASVTTEEAAHESSVTQDEDAMEEISSLELVEVQIFLFMIIRFAM